LEIETHFGYKILDFSWPIDWIIMGDKRDCQNKSNCTRDDALHSVKHNICMEKWKHFRIENGSDDNVNRDVS
jgi:hypothetical protein